MEVKGGDWFSGGTRLDRDEIIGRSVYGYAGLVYAVGACEEYANFLWLEG